MVTIEGSWTTSLSGKVPVIMVHVCCQRRPKAPVCAFFEDTCHSRLLLGSLLPHGSSTPPLPDRDVHAQVEAELVLMKDGYAVASNICQGYLSNNGSPGTDCILPVIPSAYDRVVAEDRAYVQGFTGDQFT